MSLWFRYLLHCTVCQDGTCEHKIHCFIRQTYEDRLLSLWFRSDTCSTAQYARRTRVMSINIPCFGRQNMWRWVVWCCSVPTQKNMSHWLPIAWWDFFAFHLSWCYGSSSGFQAFPIFLLSHIMGSHWSCTNIHWIRTLHVYCPETCSQRRYVLSMGAKVGNDRIAFINNWWLYPFSVGDHPRQQRLDATGVGSASSSSATTVAAAVPFSLLLMSLLVTS